MKLTLRPADDGDFEFCESLNRRSMGKYLAARGIAWDPVRFRASWAEFENLIIVADSKAVGLLRLLPENDALGLRDLQVLPGLRGQGIGTWAVRQVQSMAARRGYRRVQLRVYQENPARALYARLGFEGGRVLGGTVHMACPVVPRQDRAQSTRR